jgi:hypothetical protein
MNLPRDNGRTVTRPLSTAQIGRGDELLVQYRLLPAGMDSTDLTVDAGVDLVAYAPATGRPFTEQVKSNLGPKPGGWQRPPCARPVASLR